MFGERVSLSVVLPGAHWKLKLKLQYLFRLAVHGKQRGVRE